MRLKPDSNLRLPDVKFYTKQMNALAKAGKVYECEIMFLRMLSLNISPSVITVNVLLKAYCISTVNECSATGTSECLPYGILQALTILQTLQTKFLSFVPLPTVPFQSTEFSTILSSVVLLSADEGSYNIIINYLSRLGFLDLSVLCLRKQRDQGFRTDRALSSIIKHLSQEQAINMLTSIQERDHRTKDSPINLWDFDVTIAVVNSLLSVLYGSQKKQVYLSDISYSSQVILCQKTLDFCLATETCLPNLRTYTIILSYLASVRETLLGKTIFLEMLRQAKIKPDLVLLTTYLNCLVSNKPCDIEEIEAIVNYVEGKKSEEEFEVVTLLQKANVSYIPDIYVYTLLCKAYSNCLPPQYLKTRGVIKRIYQQKLSPNFIIVSVVLNAYCSVGEVEAAEKVLKEFMEEEWFTLSPAIYNILIKGYARCRCKVLNQTCSCIVCFCSNPDEALRLVAEMEKRSLSPDEITLNTLIDSLCSSQRFRHAKNIIDNVMKGKSSKVPPTKNTYITLLSGMVRRFLKGSCSMDQAEIVGLNEINRKVLDQSSDEIITILHEVLNEISFSPVWIEEAGGPILLLLEKLVKVIGDPMLSTRLANLNSRILP